MKTRLFFTAIVFLASAALSRAGVSYDESAVFDFNTRDDFSALAAESATFAFDTRIIDGLSAAATSGTFTFNTLGVTLPPLQITGVLRDSEGVPVAGATIQIKRAGAIFWQGVSGAGGVFNVPNLSGVNYTVIVMKPGYVTAITNITGTAGGNLALNLQSAAMPGVLTTEDVVRGLASGALRLEDVGTLQVFSGTQFVDVTGPLDPNRMTVVLSHGWHSGTGDWVTTLAHQISTHQSLGAQAPQIVAWDWHTQANRPLTGAIDVAREQGENLGKALRQRLGAGYSQRLHFIGHSFGTIVNCFACDYVHGSFVRASNNPPTHWLAAQTRPHVTMLDEAEVATVFGETVTTSAAIGWKAAQLQGALIAGTTAAVVDWKSPVPKSAVWIDNYISMVGLQHDEAVNVCLPAYAIAFLSPIHAHSYATQWYQNSIAPSGTPPPVGFGSAFESGATFPPTGTGRTAGNLWYENLATSDPFDLNLDPNPGAYEATIGILSAYTVQGAATAGNALIYQPLDAVGRSVLNGYGTGLKWAGNVGGTVIYKTGGSLPKRPRK